MEDMLFWRVGRFRTFGIKEAPIYVNGITAKAKGITWQITAVRPNDNKRHGMNVNEKYYLTNDKRSHLSFHKSIDEAQKRAESIITAKKTQRFRPFE